MCLVRNKKPDKLTDRKLLDKTLLMLSEHDPFTIRQSFEGVQVFGGTGSGKTSGSGYSFANAFLREGYGGLALTVKPDEYSQIFEWAKEQGRAEQVIRVAPDKPYFFQFLEYEAKREDGSDTEQVVSLFMIIIEIANGSQKSQDSYWENSLRTMLRNLVDLLKYAGEPINVLNMYKLLVDAPNSLMEMRSEDWRKDSYMHACMMKAAKKDQETPLPDLEVTLLYWTRDFPTLAEKTRSIIVSLFTTTADAFMRGKLKPLFSVAGKKEFEVIPQWSREGAIIILDLPIKQYGVVGKIAQGLYKLMWQQAMERTRVTHETRPVFLWADENQYFINSFDLDFQQTARSTMVCTFYLTQNISNYHVNLGKDGETKANAILGNLSTKIFHSNSDVRTNEFGSQLFGETWQAVTSTNQSYARDEITGGSASLSEQRKRIVEPLAFTTLARGGASNNYLVGSLIHQTGRIFANGSNCLHTHFSQKN